jgi:hypothetical protein
VPGRARHPHFNSSGRKRPNGKPASRKVPTVWLNENHYNTVLSKAFKEPQSGEWRDTDQLSHHDLLNAAKVLTSAQVWISEQQ